MRNQEREALLFLAKKSPFRFQISLNFKSHVFKASYQINEKRVIYTMINRNIDNQHSYNLNTLLKEETVQTKNVSNESRCHISCINQVTSKIPQSPNQSLFLHRDLEYLIYRYLYINISMNPKSFYFSSIYKTSFRPYICYRRNLCLYFYP